MKASVGVVAILVLVVLGRAHHPPTVAAQAAPTTVGVAQYAFPLCGGFDSAVLTGELHYVTGLNQAGTSSFQQLTGHLDGWSPVTDVRYVLNLSQFYAATPTSVVFTYRELLVSVGPAPNQLVVFTINTRTGEFSFTTDCRG
jgi:hypothetical protein